MAFTKQSNKSYLAKDPFETSRESLVLLSCYAPQ